MAALSGCGGSSDDVVVAEVYGHELTRAEVEAVVPEGLAPEDSAVIADNYVNQWIQQMVVLEQARRKVNKDFSEELQNYKNSLLTYEYEQQVVGEVLDTHVTEKELGEYYNANQQCFTLQTSIVRAVYVKFPKGSPSVAQVKKLMSRASLTDKDMDQIQREAALHGEDYSFDMDNWIPFYKLQSQVPIITYNEELYLKNNRNIVIEDSSSVYVVRILEYKLDEEMSPLSFERENIREMILNERRLDIIKDKQRDLLQEAKDKGKIKKYKL